MAKTRLRAFDVFILAVLAAAAAAVVIPLATQEDAGGFEVKKETDIAYYTGKDADPVRHRLDIYQPIGRTNAPVLMYVHGGAWQFGSKTFRGNIGRTFAKRGIVTICINYRLSPKVKHPEHIRDVARAFDWVKRNVLRYGGDPEDVFIGGHSAGGHLVALLALNEKYLAELGRTPDDISGVIAISGVYRVGGTGPFFKDVFEADPAALTDASPAMHVGRKQPPFLVLYADDDLTGLDVLAVDLASQLREANTPVRLLKIPNRNHVTITFRIGSEDDPTTQAMLEFIGTYSHGGKEPGGQTKMGGPGMDQVRPVMAEWIPTCTRTFASETHRQESIVMHENRRDAPAPDVLAAGTGNSP